MERKTGTLKWFSKSKGFGFIEDLEGQNIFVQNSEIEERDLGLNNGQTVHFQLIQTDRGPEAFKVVLSETEETHELDSSKNS